MENKCRLCLNDSENFVILVEGCDILEKLATSLSHYISLVEGLPNKICSYCCDKVNEIYKFHLDISQNEHILQQKQNNLTTENNGNTNEIKQEYENENEEVIEKLPIKNENDLGLDKPELASTNGNSDIENCNKDSKISTEDDKNNQKIDKYDDIPLKILKESNLNSKIEESKRFMCLTCFEVFPNQLELLKHYRTIELEKYNANNGNINEDMELVKYKQYKTEDGVMFKCEKCCKKYKHKRFVERHIKSHIDRRPFLCKLCGKTYQTASIIVAHGKMHTGQLYTCAYNCGYISVHKHVVKDHEKRHRKEYKYKCETCGKGFQVRPLFEQHQNIHQGIKPFSCDLCDSTFHLHRYLMTHRSNVHPQTSNRRPWVCKQCQLPCDSKNSLNIHLKEKHGIIVNVPILCDICGKVLKDSRQLTHHKRSVHLNIKPFTCSVCNKSFPKKCSLKVHEQIHVGKLFSCDICNKKYSRKCTLERHIKRFHMDLKCVCRKCSKAFTSKVKLSSSEQYCSQCIDIKS